MFLFFCHVACWILVPWPGIEYGPFALEAWRLNHWTAREVPQVIPILLNNDFKVQE